ncbi:uncharacterized protein LOC143055403 [Mytilus galloprovincialis]|uniref:uncharacterized protein LOC143055403 n=1 Tax=Mytilus galloprovincialis TaxID=29158 RepID=UPI003F7C0640
MGSQPSSLPSNRHLKGFVVTKQLSARRKINSSTLSKKLSYSEILTLVEYDAHDFLDKSAYAKDKLKTPHSEKIISLSEITDLTESEDNHPKKLRTFPTAVSKPNATKKASILKENGTSQICPLPKIVTVQGKDKHTKDAPNKSSYISRNNGKNMEQTTEFNHLDHWVHKNDPYIEKSDIHHHTTSNQHESATKSGENKMDAKLNKMDTKQEVKEEDGNINEEIVVIDSVPEDVFEEQKREKREKIIKTVKDISTCQHERTTDGYYTESLRTDIYEMYQFYFSFKNHSLERRVRFRHEVLEDIMKAEDNILIIFCRLSREIMKNGYRNSEGKSVAGLFKPLRNMLGFLMNLSDLSNPIVCKTILDQTEFMNSLIQKLNELATPHLNKELKENDTILLGLYMGICHNIAQKEELTSELREVGIVEAVKPYLNSYQERKQLTSLAVLANVINEEESEILKSNEGLIEYTIKSLKQAMNNKMRRTGFGWSVRETVRTIRMVAKNDNNKRTVYTCGAVPLLVELANQPGDAEEQREAVEALWSLSFDQQIQTEIINDQECGVIDTFVKLYKSAEDKGVRRICGKALWTMKSSLKNCQHYKKIGEEFSFLPVTPRESEQRDTHVMVSYNWGHQSIVKEICGQLRNNGIKVWMDIDDMHGSTLQAMAHAVEKADIVLVCYSQNYKNSDNCRAEAEYAFQLKKKVIPLKMEKAYKPDGWLGFIIGAKLFYDFSGKYPFEKKMTELINEVQSSLQTMKGVKIQVPNAEVQVQVIPQQSASSTSAAALVPVPRTKSSDVEKVKKWSPQHVGKWLDKNQLPRNLLGRLSGLEIAFLHVLVQESPDVFYKTIADQLSVKDILTMAKLRFALEALDVNI